MWAPREPSSSGRRSAGPRYVAEIAELDLQLDSNGKVEAYRAKVKVSFKYEGS